MLLDRVERHHQVVGDATVGQARGEQPQHLQLAQVARRPLPPARSLLATGRSPALPPGRPPRRDLHAPADPLQQQAQAGHLAAHPNRLRPTSAIRASVRH